MNKPFNGNEHNDDDIAEVFDAQRIAVPGDLRQSILEQAALEAEKPQASITSTAEDTSFKSTGKLNGIAAFTQKQGALSAAIAASIVVLIIGVPFTFDSPQPGTAQTMDAQSAESMSVDAQSVEAEPILQAESDSVGAARAPAQAEEPIQSAEPANLAFESAESLRMTDQKSTAGNAPQDTGAKRAPAYRQTADTWINQIKVLIADGQPIKAKEEYILFEQQFPEEAKDYQPDFSRRITEIPDENPDPIDGARH